MTAADRRTALCSAVETMIVTEEIFSVMDDRYGNNVKPRCSPVHGMEPTTGASWAESEGGATHMTGDRLLSSQVTQMQVYASKFLTSEDDAWRQNLDWLK